MQTGSGSRRSSVRFREPEDGSCLCVGYARPLMHNRRQVSHMLGIVASSVLAVGAVVHTWRWSLWWLALPLVVHVASTEAPDQRSLLGALRLLMVEWLFLA